MLALKCMTFAQARLVTSTGSTLHSSIAICTAVLKIGKGSNSEGKQEANSGQTKCQGRSKQFSGDNGNKPVL